MAWFRTAMLLQRIVEDIFAISSFIDVDDCFWVAPEFPQERGPDAAWQALVFDYVIQELLGWKLAGENGNWVQNHATGPTNTHVGGRE